MLFLLFQLDKDRYAIEASRVVEVVPYVTLKKLPQAPPGVAGIFNYRGRPVPVVDLGAPTRGRPARELIRTRILVVHYPHDPGPHRLLGLVAEHATELLRKEPGEFTDPGVTIGAAPYLGPVVMDGTHPVQLIHEERLLTEPVRKSLFEEPLALP